MYSSFASLDIRPYLCDTMSAISSDPYPRIHDQESSHPHNTHNLGIYRLSGSNGSFELFDTKRQGLFIQSKLAQADTLRNRFDCD